MLKHKNFVKTLLKAKKEGAIPTKTKKLYLSLASSKKNKNILCKVLTLFAFR